MNIEDLDRLETLLEKATKGEWLWDQPGNWFGINARVCSEKYEPIAAVAVSGWPKRIGVANAELITTMHNNLPALIAAARKQLEAANG